MLPKTFLDYEAAPCLVQLLRMRHYSGRDIKQGLSRGESVLQMSVVYPTPLALDMPIEALLNTVICPHFVSRQPRTLKAGKSCWTATAHCRLEIVKVFFLSTEALSCASTDECAYCQILRLPAGYRNGDAYSRGNEKR